MLLVVLPDVYGVCFFLLPAMDAPGTYLTAGRSLKGMDILPVVIKLKGFNVDNRPGDDELASISAKFPLTSYTEKELKEEFRKLTGYGIDVVLPLAALDDTIGNVRLALHASVEYANSLPAPGQTLKEAGEGPSAASSAAGEDKKKKGGKRVSGPNIICVV